jgi:hypothetical protein
MRFERVRRGRREEGGRGDRERRRGRLYFG